MKRNKQSSNQHVNASGWAVEKLVARLKKAGVYGKKLGELARMGHMCGPYYIYRDVVEAERQKGL